MAPTVSIIIPCFQADTTIVEAVNGVLNQTLTDWECILVSDDGRSYLDLLGEQGINDPRIVEHPERSNATGTVAPRNRGFEMVRGEFVADLDADDIWQPERLERLVPLADQYGCAQDLLECFGDNGVLGCSGEPDGSVTELHVADVVSFDFPFHLVVRRDRAGSQWSAHDSWVPDVIRTLLLTAKSPGAWLHEPLLRYRVSSTSMSQSLEGSRKIDAAYDDVLQNLEATYGFELNEQDRSAALRGIERKKALNLRYISEMKTVERPVPFIAWLLAYRHSGFVENRTI